MFRGDLYPHIRVCKELLMYEMRSFFYSVPFKQVQHSNISFELAPNKKYSELHFGQCSQLRTDNHSHFNVITTTAKRC